MTRWRIRVTEKYDSASDSDTILDVTVNSFSLADLLELIESAQRDSEEKSEK